MSVSFPERAAIDADLIRGLVREQFPAGVSCTDPDGGMFCWVTLPAASGIDTTALLATAVDHNVAYVPGQPFFAGDEGSNTLRLSYVTSTEQEIHRAIFEETGIYASACRHGFMLWICDMVRSGELYVCLQVRYVCQFLLMYDFNPGPNTPLRSSRSP